MRLLLQDWDFLKRHFPDFDFVGIQETVLVEMINNRISELDKEIKQLDFDPYFKKDFLKYEIQEFKIIKRNIKEFNHVKS